MVQALHHSAVLKKELSRQTKLFVFKAIFVPIFTCGYESWAMNEPARSQMQACEIKFLQTIKGVTIFDKVRNTAIRESLNIELLPLRIEKYRLGCLGHASRMPQKKPVEHGHEDRR